MHPSDVHTYIYTCIHPNRNASFLPSSHPLLLTLIICKGQDGGVEDTWPWAVRDSHHPYRNLGQERIFQQLLRSTPGTPVE